MWYHCTLVTTRTERTRVYIGFVNSADKGNKMKWISFEDELPDIDVDVLITDKHRIAIGCLFDPLGYMSWSVVTSDLDMFSIEIDGSYWMPLPETPK